MILIIVEQRRINRLFLRRAVVFQIGPAVTGYLVQTIIKHELARILIIAEHWMPDHPFSEHVVALKIGLAENGLPVLMI